MRILWVNSGLGRTLSNTRLFGMPPALQELGHESIVLIGGRADADLPSYFRPLLVPFGRLKLYRLLVTLLLPFLCLKYRPDVLLSDWMSAKLTRLALTLSKMGLLPCIFVHDVRTVPVKEDQGKSWNVFAGSLRFAQANFDGITTITEPLAEEIEKLLGVPRERMAVWTSGVDLEHFKPQDASEQRQKLGLASKTILFYHGNVQLHRGVVELVQAMDLLRDQQNLCLLIVGGGHEWPTVQRLVDDLNLKNILLQPGVPYGEIPKWIACADLCIVPLPDHPWWRVSSPLKLMEYLAMGKPILLTDMKAHRAVLPQDDDAFYIAKCHPEDFAGGIRRALHDASRFAELGERGRQRASEALSWKKQAKILGEYLERVQRGDTRLRGRRS